MLLRKLWVIARIRDPVELIRSMGFFPLNSLHGSCHSGTIDMASAGVESVLRMVGGLRI